MFQVLPVSIFLLNFEGLFHSTYRMCTTTTTRDTSCFKPDGERTCQCLIDVFVHRSLLPPEHEDSCDSYISQVNQLSARSLNGWISDLALVLGFWFHEIKINYELSPCPRNNLHCDQGTAMDA